MTSYSLSFLFADFTGLMFFEAGFVASLRIADDPKTGVIALVVASDDCYYIVYSLSASNPDATAGKRQTEYLLAKSLETPMDAEKEV